MNQDHSLNNNDKPNGFTLVRRPSSAVEKAAPGAKRILSGMVADTLTLAKPVFMVVLCGYHDGYSGFLEMLGVIIQKALFDKFTVEIDPFTYVEELVKTKHRKPFNLILIFLNPVLLRKQGQSNTLNQDDTLELVARLKSELQKPILIVTNHISYSNQHFPLFLKVGASAFLGMPFSTDEVRSALIACGIDIKN